MDKFCTACGEQISSDVRFCENCGADITGTETEVISQNNYEQGFTQDSDGKYRWYYELNMFKNPTVFITLCKVFGGVVFGLGLFLGLLVPEEFSEKIKFILYAWLYGSLGFLVLGGFSYVLYAVIQGGKYCVVFEMDEKSVKHIQLAKQFKKAQVISALAALAGVNSGSLTITGTGILSGSRAMMETEFKSVNKIEVSRRRNVIYLNASLAWNQIYVQPENFDMVLSFILSHIPEQAMRKGV